jgi:arylsulfatase A-like enzyme
MNRIGKAGIFFAGAAVASSGLGAEKPNLVFIMADDMGFSDLGCYGGEAATPNLDRLASEGVRFNQFYNSGKCEPTRTALMTGHRNTPQIGFYGEQAKTFMPEKLREQGYRTILCGKWHVSRHPLDRGFDRFFGHEEGASNFWTGSGRLQLGREKYAPEPGYYSTDTFTDFALKFLDESKGEDPSRPFFLFLSYTAPHDPLQAPEEEIAKYCGKYMAGYHEVQERRLERLRASGLIPRDANPVEWPQNLPRWETLTDAQKRMEDLRMATFTAMIDRMDQNIGRLVDWLKANDKWDNTLIVFVSDNGSNPFDRRSENMVRARILPGGPNSEWALGTAWAHVSNTPFRMYKRNMHEGGICAPMILRWPGSAYESGSITDLPVHVLDFLPSFYALAGGTQRPAGIEGTDLSGLWRAGTQTREYEIMDYMVDHRYIRRNDWKLVSMDGQPWELFNLAADRTESRDLIADYPELVRELETAWDAWYGSFSKQRFDEKEENPRQQKNRTGAHMGDKGSGVPYVPVAMP